MKSLKSVLIWIVVLNLFWGIGVKNAFCQENEPEFKGDKQSFEYLRFLFKHDKDLGISYEHLASRYKNRIPDGLIEKFFKRKRPSNYERGYYAGEIKLVTDHYYAFYYERPCYKRDLCRVGYLSTLSKEGALISNMVFSYDSSNQFTHDTMNSRIIQQGYIESVKWHARYKQNGGIEKIKDFDTTKYRYYKLSDSGVIEKLPQFTKTPYRKYPFTSYRLVQPDELDEYSWREQTIMKNEIFADYGYKFEIDQWREYFSNKDWYEPTREKVHDSLNTIERLNLKRIVKYQRRN